MTIMQQLKMENHLNIKKAEELQAKGSEIEIIPEDIFYELIGEGQ